MISEFFKLIRLLFINLSLILVLLAIVDPILGKIIQETDGIDRGINFKENNPFSRLKIASEIKGAEEFNLKRTDQYGFILGPGENSTSKIDFIFLGSSTVESEDVHENKRYPFLSIEKLNKHLNTNFVSRNAGVGGNLISASNLILTTKIVDLDPEYIVLSSSLIDMLYLSRNQSYWTGSKKYILDSDPGSSLLKSVKETFFSNIWLQMRKFIVSNDTSDFESSEFSPRDVNRILGHYEQQLEVFINTCLIYDITPILTTDYFVSEIVKEELVKKAIFSPEEVNFYLNTLIPELNLLIVNKAKEYNIPIIDLKKLVEEDPHFVNNRDGVHLTNTGSEKVSEVISNYLARKILNEEI